MHSMIPIKPRSLVAFLILIAGLTPVSAQEAMMVVQHKVADYERWDRGFTGALPFRRNAGEISSYILHNPGDPNLVIVWFEWDTLARAQAFAASPALADGMAAAGVVSEPTFQFWTFDRSTAGYQPVQVAEH